MTDKGEKEDQAISPWAAVWANTVSDRPGVFVPPAMFVLSSRAGGFRERVAGPRGYCVDGSYCSKSASVPLGFVLR